MFTIGSITRDNIKKLKPYSSARDEFAGQASVWLDANENSLGSPIAGSYHRYPDPHQRLIKRALAEQKNVRPGQVFLGNGSDECIDLLYRCFCEPGATNVIVQPPTYGMYEVYAQVNAVAVKAVPLQNNFQPDEGSLLSAIDGQTRIVWFCSPNNPTGNAIDASVIKNVLDRFNGLVVVDEAYAGFSQQDSFVNELENYPNLVVLQTFSKAWGLAGLRVGMAFASPEIIAILSKVKPPYNIGEQAQKLVLEALAQADKKQKAVAEIVQLRDQLSTELKKAGLEVFPSDANFLLVRMDDADAWYKRLLEKGIVTRNRSSLPGCESCLRITVGTAVENALLVAALTGGEVRTSIHERKTNETRARVQINLEGRGRAQISTGLRFFDHMLEQVSRHGQVDLYLEMKGDLDIDEHHTIEDTAISLGEAFAIAVGDKRGMERYGFSLPMDDADATVLIDFGGRSWLVWDVELKRERIGDVPTEMFYHFFKSFSDAAKCNLNIRAHGENEHHKIEAVFKAFARAIRMAVKKDPLSNYLPSTKGVL